MPSILIIDDSPDIRRALRLLFDSMGWEVCCEAANGRDGIEQAHRLKPNIAVVDMSLPRMDGLAVAKTLKAELPTLPVIMFTSFEESQFLKREVSSAGIRQVVSKSNPKGLVQAIEQASKAA